MDLQGPHAQSNETRKLPQISDARARSKDIAVLNGLLRGELSAVETYTQCIERLDDGDVERTLRELRRSHEIRCDLIRTRVELLGGTADSHSGVWGAIAGVLEGGATLIGEKAALRLLEEGELHGIRHYDQLGEMSSATRTFIFNELLPEQERTTATLRSLRKRFE
ncbi:MAG: DUF2383 domain-containing protein [Nannocystaceae bacterium]|nr:PA2169 family four-helix-bundle protein [bacterium]